MKTKSIIILVTIIINVLNAAAKDTLTISEDLKLVRLAKRSWLHISYIPFNGKKIQCNGVVFINAGEAVVMDTPVTDKASIELILWIENDQNARVKYLVVNHFHEDCDGGIVPFMDKKVENYSQKQTCKLAKRDGFICTMRYFTDTLTLKVGNKSIECWYPGPAHTQDNIVTYIPSIKLLFGGCMIKSIGSDSGNVRDANLEKWSTTVGKVKDKYSKAKRVVPGHGNPGNRSLIDYTIKLFEPQ